MSIRKQWSSKDEQTLIDNFTTRSTEELVALFNMGWSAIKCKAHKLGLNRKKLNYNKEELLADYDKGMTMSAICDKYVMSSPSLYTILKTNNRSRNNTITDIDSFKIDYSFLAMPQLVDKYNVSRPTIRAKAKELSLVRPEHFLHKQSRFTDNLAKEIHKLYIEDGWTMTQLADKYGGAIHEFITKQGWNITKEETQAKREKTNILKYGTAMPLASLAIKEKIKQTCLEKYGVASAGGAKEIIEKRAQTCLDKYGSNSPFGNADIKQKIISTNIQKYGTASPLSSTVVKEKRAQTCLNKYGSRSCFGDKEVQQRISETNIERYGTAHPNRYGKTQKEIQDWLAELGVETKSDTKILEGKEIDLYSEELKVGIEYCGLFWHTENSPEPRDKSYHYNKYKMAQEKGVKLITVFEDEWKQREAQVKGFLKSVLGKNTIKLHARKCELKTLSKDECKDFYDKYHIQGSNHSGKYFAGLFYNNELVGAMSIGLHPRDSDQLVLDRLCFKENVSIAGGSSRLFSFLLKETKVDKIISWSDNRWGTGNVYSKLGFVLDEELAPDYSYVDIKNAYTRLSKQSQKKDAVDCPAHLTELQWANQRGLHRIWDCGKKRWVYSRNEVQTVIT